MKFYVTKLLFYVFFIYFSNLQVFSSFSLVQSSPSTTVEPEVENSTEKALIYQLFNNSENLTSVLVSNYDFSPSDSLLFCPKNETCSNLPAVCLECSYNNTCVYGHQVTTQCRPLKNVICSGNQISNVSHECLYCYQTKLNVEHTCVTHNQCKNNGYMNQKYIANCSVNPNVFCLGRRSFKRLRNCVWTSGKRWRTALIYSITLGGLGADRFYLGHWKEGLGKIFSFGGVGVWTLIDVLLIATGYLTPADGSMYI